MTAKGDCKKCPKYTACKDIGECINHFIRANLNNIESPRRKKRIRIVYLHDLEAYEGRKVESMFYGEYDED